MLIGKHIFVVFLRVFVIRNFCGTCSSIEMLKVCMARESLGTPVVKAGLTIGQTRQMPGNSRLNIKTINWYLCNHSDLSLFPDPTFCICMQFWYILQTI